MQIWIKLCKFQSNFPDQFLHFHVLFHNFAGDDRSAWTNSIAAISKMMDWLYAVCWWMLMLLTATLISMTCGKTRAPTVHHKMIQKKIELNERSVSSKRSSKRNGTHESSKKVRRQPNVPIKPPETPPTTTSPGSPSPPAPLPAKVKPLIPVSQKERKGEAKPITKNQKPQDEVIAKEPRPEEVSFNLILFCTNSVSLGTKEGSARKWKGIKQRRILEVQ